MKNPARLIILLCALTMAAMPAAAEMAAAMPRATADTQPMARIRSANRREGLTPMAFAIWVAAQPQRWAINAPIALKPRPASRAALLNLTSELFHKADSNRDGRISPAELADLSSCDIDTVTPAEM